MNFILALLCVAAFVVILEVGILKVETTDEKKILAIQTIFASTIIPAIIFFLNGLVIGCEQPRQIDRIGQKDDGIY